MKAWVLSDLTKVLISKAVCGELDWDEANFSKFVTWECVFI